MNTLHQAVQEYLMMRRDLGFKLTDAGKALPDFVAFLRQHRATHITSELALAWAQQPRNVQPAHWAQRLSYVRGFARYRSATDPRTQIPRRASCRSAQGAHDPTSIRRTRSPTCCAPHSV